MKVLYSCLSRSWGGMEMFTLTAINALIKKGIEVELLCFNGSNIHNEAVKLNIKAFPLNAKGYFNYYSVFRVAKIINSGRYSLIHTQASKDLWVIVPALKLAGSNIPLFLTKQMNSAVIKKDFLHKALYKRVTKIFAISNAVKENLFYSCPVYENQVELLFNSVDVKKFVKNDEDRKLIRKEYSIEDNEIVIGMLARLSHGKGHEELLNAAKILNDKYSGLKFLIVGEASRGEDEYAERVKEMPKRLGLNNIIFAGYRSDVYKLLNGYDIFVFPSHSEAFGIALIEAMAMNLPAVCSDTEGVLDIAVDNETGYLFKTKNAEDLAEKIGLLIDSPGKRELFGKNGRKRVEEVFDTEILTAKVLTIYKQFLP